MKTFLLIFFLSFLFIVFLFVINSKIPQTGKLIDPLGKQNEKWRVVARVEIMNGRIVSIVKNFTIP
ncbi:MAG: hypothetical protein QW423_00445 [Candidatus Aenigmatarchaeota archaeon]